MVFPAFLAKVSKTTSKASTREVEIQIWDAIKMVFLFLTGFHKDNAKKNLTLVCILNLLLKSAHEQPLRICSGRATKREHRKGKNLQRHLSALKSIGLSIHKCKIIASKFNYSHVHWHKSTPKLSQIPGPICSSLVGTLCPYPCFFFMTLCQVHEGWWEQQSSCCIYIDSWFFQWGDPSEATAAYFRALVGAGGLWPMKLYCCKTSQWDENQGQQFTLVLNMALKSRHSLT